MNFYVIKIQNFCDRAKPWLGKVEALFHAIHPLLLGYEKRVCRNFDTPSVIVGSNSLQSVIRNHFPTQKVIIKYKAFIISNIIALEFLLRDKLGTKSDA